LKFMLDETEFLSPYGIRALSRYHKDHPFLFRVNGTEYRVDYEPAESTTGLFGGNSNWRGPIWFPVNFLIIEALQKFHFYFGDEFTVECPTGSGRYKTLWEVSQELSSRLIKIFERDDNNRRAVFGQTELYHSDPLWRDFIPFHEYFHAETGWTGLIAKLIQQQAEWLSRGKNPTFGSLSGARTSSASSNGRKKTNLAFT
jgi:hypothetical protein